jgi:hypothetical protein
VFVFNVQLVSFRGLLETESVPWIANKESPIIAVVSCCGSEVLTGITVESTGAWAAIFSASSK